MTQLTTEDVSALRRRSRAQWVFRALLEDEANRSVSVTELCRRAGYQRTTAVKRNTQAIVQLAAEKVALRVSA